MTTRSKAILAVHRLLLRAAGFRGRRLWRLAYRLAAHAWAAFLIRGEPGASAYARGSVGAGDVVPGLSDVDVAVVLAGDSARPGRAVARVTARWSRLRRALALTDLLFDYPLILEQDELARLVGGSTFTFGLEDSSGPGVGYLAEPFPQDRVRLLERPGLYEMTRDWRPLRGPERRPAERARDPQLRRIAAWLELCSWWQWVFGACADPAGPRTASLCVKLVAEPARIWLWLAHGERVSGRSEVLTRTLALLPEEEGSLRRAQRLLGELHTAPEPPLAQVLPILLRLSERIAQLIEAEIADAGATDVRLPGAGNPELIMGHGGWIATAGLAAGREPRALPLSDWRSLASPVLPDETLVLVEGDPVDPSLLALASISQSYGPYPAFRSGRLMMLPGQRARTRLRAITCSATDPVSFALAEGQAEAAFPEVAGWSARDTAARAVAEHRMWLSGRTPLWAGQDDVEGTTLGMLFSAARSALFAESLAAGDVPELALTVSDTAHGLAALSATAGDVADEGVAHYREFASHRTPPPAAIVDALRRVVRALPALSAPD